MEARTEQVVNRAEEQFAAARDRHPEFEGKTAAITLFNEGQFYLLGPEDLRTLLFTSLGFELPEQAGPVSRERTDLRPGRAGVYRRRAREQPRRAPYT
jgi:iron complex transport system substrate-binding protein